MNRMKFGSIALLTAALTLAGCGDDDGGNSGADGGGGGGDTCMTGDSHTFIVNVLAVGESVNDETPGFNLDDRVSDENDELGCYHADFTSPAPDSVMGVDNQLGGLLTAIAGLFPDLDITTAVADAIATGQVLILVEVSNVDDLTDDSCVSVRLSLGQLPSGVTMPELTGGTLSPGQTFDILQANIASAQGAIAGGRLAVGRITNVPINVPFCNDANMDGMTTSDECTTITLNIQNAEMRFDITGTTMARGVIGGGIDVTQATDAIAGISDAVPRTTVEEILNAQADLEPDATNVCTSVSVGLTFSGVTATLGT